jgi:hypothetical protein
MLNVHRRMIDASVDEIRPWIESAWTGTDRDIFPRDVIRSWRKNPPGIDPLALVPNVTRVGHGMFSFRFDSWDGTFWRVRVESKEHLGWHGFDLRPVGERTEITHTLEMDLKGKARVLWPALMNPIHDWCVEAIFDRLEEALRTGKIPAISDRPMPLRTDAALRTLRALVNVRAGRRVERRTTRQSLDA